jgi:SNF2 family DNA or RNA helicase
MAADAGDTGDPFLWDEERVVQELCTENRSWRAPPSKRLPDPAALEAKLRDCGVDGESLLTYEDEFGFDQLWGYLGVKKLPHQLSLKDAITQFRRRSPRYLEWKSQQMVDSQIYSQNDHGLATKSESQTPGGLEQAIQAAPATGPIPGAAGAEPNTDLPDLKNSCPGVQSPAQSPSADHGLPLSPGASECPSPDQEATEGPPSKRRRIAPTNVSTTTTGNDALHIIPTEGDIFFKGTPEALLQASDSAGFLGPGVLRLTELMRPPMAAEGDPPEFDFAFMGTQLPPGRRIQVSAALKRFFRSSRVDRPEPTLEAEEDPILPLLGESDDEEVDSQTWQEFQEEEAERAALEARKQAAKERILSRDDVARIIDRAIQDLEAQWVAEKKPKYDLRAWRIWQDARRNPDRLEFISSVRRTWQRLHDRIAVLSKHILDEPWTVEDRIHEKALDYLEVSVFEKKHQDWLIDVLQSPRQPPKPSRLTRPTRRRTRPTVLEDDEEILTSDSDDFIEYDDEAVPLPSDEMDIDSDPPPEQAPVSTSPGDDEPAMHNSEEDVRLVPAEALPSGEQVDNDFPPAQPTPQKIKAEKVLAPATPGQATTWDPEVIEIDSSPSPLKRLDRLPSLDDLENLELIGQIGLDHWEKVGDAERLVVAVLCEWSRGKLVKLYDAVKNRDHAELWAEHMSPTFQDPASATIDKVAFHICRLFDVFISKTAKRADKQRLRSVTCDRMNREGNRFAPFCALLTKVIPLFLGTVPRTPTRIVLKTPRKESQAAEEMAEIQDPAQEASASQESSEEGAPPSTRKRRQRVRRDKNAMKIRIDTLKVTEEHARRSRLLRERMAEQGSMSSKEARLIVNETKESDDQALIYINDHIGKKIKDHQIEGVRFMWNQVVVDSSVRQGCLLAHTMGLGKTMQVITLLVVIAESSASPDESVRSQIPENLRESKTLILCPSSLVDNWLEELQMWAPGDVLGPTWCLESSLSTPERLQTIRDWASSGGVLVTGYHLFTTLVRTDEEVAELLRETPNLVVGDEAHYLKNPNSQRHQAAANFRTMNRIAMTGSPLTNNVMDYYSMINWVAPNYLADIAEFKQRFSIPIKEGLYADSEPYQKRKARKMLQVLKATVEPKVHRRDIDVLVNELPKKKEFILTLPLTKHQRRLYAKYIELVTDPLREQTIGTARAWSLVAKLSLVLAHPFIFKTSETEKAKTRRRAAEAARSSAAADGQKSEETDEAELSQDILHELLATVAVREIESYELSNKILVLLRILEECRKVRDKVLVFSQSISTLDFIENICKRQKYVYQRLDGATRIGTRQSSIKKFNTDAELEVYLISTTAGGVGLNIYGANRVVIFDFKYTPAEEQQAIGRAYRLGQTKEVFVYWLTVGGTFEDTIHNQAVFKTQLASRVVDKKNPDPYSKRVADYFAMPRVVDQEDLSGAKGQDPVLDALLESEICQHIRKITSTETFEKEETYELTAEEKKEVDQDVELELLRSQNPEEFKRRERERAFQLRPMFPMPPAPPGVYQPRSTDGESHTAPQCTPDRGKMIVRIKVPEHLREKRKPEPPVPNVVSGAASAQHTPLPAQPENDHPQQQILTLNSDAALISPPAPFTQNVTSISAPPAPATAQSPPAQDHPPVRQPNTTRFPSPNSHPLIYTNFRTEVPQPVLASGSHFKGAQTPSPSAFVSGSPVLRSPETAPSIDDEVSNLDFPELWAVHRKVVADDGRHVRHHPSELISRVRDELNRNKIEKLPKLDKIQNLKKCSRNPRFAEAMLSGYMEPAQLASLTRAEMEAITATLDGMAEPEFKQRVWTAKADLNVCNTGTKST